MLHDLDEPQRDATSADVVSRGPEADFESLLRMAAHVPDYRPTRLLEVGEILAGKYRIEELLGRGGMAAVYRATHLISEKPVAIKWMLAKAQDQQAHKRFLREARLCGRIQHPNVVDVYDVGSDAESAYLVMELLRGQSLRARLNQGPLSLEETVALLLAALRGVAAAHKAGVIHRDLKPDNIFLCDAPEGSPPVAKVLDFGVSVRAEHSGHDSMLTQAGALIGTPAYMSPEQLQAAHDLDARTDVYAFGVILYEVLTGRLPFTGNSFSALILAISSQSPQPVCELRPDLPVQLGRVIARALEKQRDARYASVAELSRDLAVFSADANSGSMGRPRTSRATARRWLQPALLGLAFGSLVADSPLQSLSAPVHALEPVRRELAQAQPPAAIVQLSPFVAEAQQSGPASIRAPSVSMPSAERAAGKRKRARADARRAPPTAAPQDPPERELVPPTPRRTISLDEL